MIARKHSSSSRGRIYKCPMQSQTLQVMGRSNASEHEMRNTGVEEIEVGEILDGYRLECEVPIMVQTRTRCFKVRSFRSSTVRISTVSGTGRPYKLRVNLRSLSNAEIPLEERSFPLYSWSKQGKEEECDTHMEIFVRLKKSFNHFYLHVWVPNPFKVSQCFERRQRCLEYIYECRCGTESINTKSETTYES